MMAIKIKLLFLFLIFLFFSNSFQAQKKYVTEADYEKWTSISPANLSKDGKWAYYNISNIHIRGMTNPENLADTLELTELETLKRFIYPFGTNPKFTDNNKWFTCLHENQFVLLDLKTQEEQRFDSVQSYELALNGTLSLMRIQNKDNLLRILNTETKEVSDIPNVLSYSLNPDKTSMVILEQSNSTYTLKKFDLDTPQYSITLKDNLNYSSQFRWSESGNLLAFYEEKVGINQEYKDHVLHCLNLKAPSKNKTLESVQLKQDFYLNSHVITFTKDESRINFIAFPKKEIKSISDPLIWRSSDSIQPPKEIEYNKQWLITWLLETNTLTEISNKDNVIASGDLKHFFFLDNSNYLPTHKFDNYYNDILYYNIETGNTKLIDDKFIIDGRSDAISVSPKGGYFTWIKGKDWWTYDITNDIKYCLTCNINDDFSISKDMFNHPNVPYNFAIYSTDGNDIILTAKQNIWKFNFTTHKGIPLIDSNNKKISYKIEAPQITNSQGTNYIKYIKEPINLSDGLFIFGYNNVTNEEYLHLYRKDTKSQFITSSVHSIRFPKITNSSITFTLSNYDLPPQIIHSNIEKMKIIRKSNKQQDNYYWGHSEPLTYIGPNNEILKGALYYPGDYNPQEKYPVIFEIYSDVSIYLKTYTPLTLENSVAFNPSLLTSKGYFVFRPDIKYNINYTGQSALNCVLAGIEAITKIPGVDITRLGLFGQSFGGFEASYIATQTDMFKAIISSAGWHDLVDTYLVIDDVNRFNYFRFEYSQLRIKTPFFSKTFLDNSPILQAYKINTPMLLIAGTNDRRVYWENSMKMQLALTKLQKKSTLLLYRNEDHVITKKENQIDLNRKVLQWWDYHLKNTSNPNWN